MRPNSNHQFDTITNFTLQLLSLYVVKISVGIAMFYMAEHIMLICKLSRKSLQSTYVYIIAKPCT